MTTKAETGFRKVIPEHMNPPVASEIVERDGVRYLQSNEAMFTFYKRTKGELSKYFLGLRDERRIYGVRCPRCGGGRAVSGAAALSHRVRTSMSALARRMRRAISLSSVKRGVCRSSASPAYRAS